MRVASDLIDLSASTDGRSQSTSMTIRVVTYGHGEQSNANDHPRQNISMARAVRIVGLLAFGQSFLFLVLWLFLCASAGAASTKRPEYPSELQRSTYAPKKTRDPFGKIGGNSPQVKSVPGAVAAFQLEGILYQSVNPSAVVNGHLLTLHKTVTINIGDASVTVKAVEITRDHVVLETGGQKVELQLNQSNSSGQSSP